MENCSTVYIYEEDGVFQASHSHSLSGRFIIDGEDMVVGIGISEDNAYEELRIKEAP